MRGPGPGAALPDRVPARPARRQRRGRLRLSGTRGSEQLKVLGRRWAIAGGQQCPEPAVGAGGGFGSPGPRVCCSPGELPAPGPCPARSPRSASPGSSAVLPQPPAASYPGEPEVRVYSLLGSEKLQLLTVNGVAMTRDRFYSSVAFPSCRLLGQFVLATKPGSVFKPGKRKP